MKSFDAYRDDRMPGVRGFPAGPMGHIRDPPFGDGPIPLAIGFCPRCGTNARRTTQVRGLFDCPYCIYAWYDDRVGQQSVSFADFFTCGGDA